MFKDASKFVTDLTSTGKLILFVGTKRQAQDAVAEEANRAGMPYINSRWPRRPAHQLGHGCRSRSSVSRSSTICRPTAAMSC